MKFHQFLSSCHLENEVTVTKILSALKLVLMVYLCEFEENPTTGSRDILNTRLWPWKWGQGHQNLNMSSTCHYDIYTQVRWISIHLFKKYLNFSKLINFCRLVIDLENGGGSLSPNHYQLFIFSSSLKCWNGGNLAKGLRDISILVKIYLFKSSSDTENEVKVTKV